MDFPPDAFVSEILSLHDERDALMAEVAYLTESLAMSQKIANSNDRLRASLATARADALEEAAANVKEYADHLRREWTSPRGHAFSAIMNALGHARVGIRSLMDSPTAPPAEIPHPATPEPETPPSVAPSAPTGHSGYREF